MAKKILVVDDDPALVKLIEQVLSGKDYSVVKASSGQEALRVMFEQKPDLVLLDVVMPGMDGWQTCTRIREVSDLPIIMLTGKKNTEDDIVLGLSHGADEYLVKPVGNKELLARVQAVLRRAELPSRAEKKKKNFFSDIWVETAVVRRARQIARIPCHSGAYAGDRRRLMSVIFVTS